MLNLPRARVGPPMPPVDGQRAPEPPCEIDGVDRQVVEPEQKETDIRKKRKLGGDAREDVGGMHDRCPKDALRPDGRAELEQMLETLRHPQNQPSGADGTIFRCPKINPRRSFLCADAG